MVEETNGVHNEDLITIIDEEGNESLYQILFTFDSDDFDKSYVLVYPEGASLEVSEDEDPVEILAFSYIESEAGGEGKLHAVETDAEWEMIEEVLATFTQD